MPKYVVKIEGRNFYGRHMVTQKDLKYGFITVVLVESLNLEMAEMDAIAVLKDDENLREFPKNTKGDSPTLHVDDITEVEDWPLSAYPRSGLVWYPE